MVYWEGITKFNVRRYRKKESSVFYFITNRQDVLTSAIEIAQVKRLRIFDRLKQEAKIITVEYNHAHQAVEAKLGVTGRVLNLFQYFQQLAYQPSSDDRRLVNRLLHQPDMTVDGLVAMRDGKARIKAHLNAGRLYYVDYLDHFGFTDRRDFYDSGCRTYTEFFEDRARVVTRQYYDAQGRVKIVYHYRGGKDNVPILTLIQLWDQGQEYQFDSEMALRAYFLDQLVRKDPQTVLIADRSNVILPAFKLMKTRVPAYQVFHSAFTEDGQADGKLFAVYEPIADMLKAGQLRGLISATQREAQDAARRFATSASYGIPVTYLGDDVLKKSVPFNHRRPGQLIAVARLTTVKRLDHLINTVALLHAKYPQVDLKIYGFEDSWDNYAASNSLKHLVQERQAGDYVHFCGYQHDLTGVYETAQVEVLTSSYEGFAMALLEAQGHGCPVVSYDINYGPAEIIDDGVSGRLVPAGDTHTLYVTLADLLKNPAKLKGYADHAQDAAAKFSLENVTQKWADFLNREDLVRE